MIRDHREAFSLVTAVFLIVLMAGIALYVMSLSGKIVKETTTQYKREQAMLLAKSYTELAIMTVTANERNGTNACIFDINASVGSLDPKHSGEGYRVRTRIAYIGAKSDIGSCVHQRKLDFPSDSNNDLNIIVDVYVQYKDINQEDIPESPWITYHRRTLQKI